MSNPYSFQPNQNPYQPPQAPSMPPAPMQMQGTGAGMWRQGDHLVITKGLIFPNRCPVTNQPATTRYDYEFSYLSSSARVTGAMFGALGNAIAASMATKASYQIPHTDEFISSYRSNLAIGVGGLLIGILIAVGGAVAMSANSETMGLALIILGVLLAVGGIIWLVATSRDLAAYYISDTHCWITGCSPEFLATLPLWPYETPVP